MWFFSRKNRREPKAHTPRPRFRLQVETLEDRCLLSVAGALDLGFGSGGIVTTDFLHTDSYNGSPAPSDDEAYGIAVQPSDGKIVLVGQTYQDSTGWDFAVARYNPDGTLDNTFGPDLNGRVTIDFGSQNDWAVGATIQSDGKILVLGTKNDEAFAVARLDANGILDINFGPDHNGLVLVDIEGVGGVGSDIAFRAFSQGDKILITGVFGYYTYGDGGNALVRLNSADGSIDNSFGTSGNGQVVIDLYGDCALQPDGKIIVAGYDGVARLTAEGYPDNTFGTLGFQSISFTGFGVAIDANSDILVAGRNEDGYGQDFIITRLNGETGVPDTSFGTSGEQRIDYFGNGHEVALGLAVASDGKIVVVGWTEQPDDYYVALTRLATNGEIDTSFGTEGRALIYLANASDSWGGMALQLDGSILLPGGSYQPDTNGDFALAKVNGFTDTDDDGIADSVDTQPTLFSNDFSDGTTTGTITNRGNQAISIVDAPNPADGLLITSDFTGGPTPATISVLNGGSMLSLGSGAQLVATHGSVILNVLTGTVEATLVADSGQVATTTLTAGNGLTFKPESFTFIAPATNTQTVQVVSGGAELSVGPGTTVRSVQIDVSQGDTSVNLASNGVISVTIFSTSGFNASQVDVSSVIFAGAHATQFSLTDVNGDGLLDLVLKFHTGDTNLRSLYEQLLADDINGDGVLDSNHQTATVKLTGETVDHVLIEGFDELDLFLSGKKLRDLLEQLAASGQI